MRRFEKMCNSKFSKEYGIVALINYNLWPRRTENIFFILWRVYITSEQLSKTIWCKINLQTIEWKVLLWFLFSNVKEYRLLKLAYLWRSAWCELIFLNTYYTKLFPTVFGVKKWRGVMGLESKNLQERMISTSTRYHDRERSDSNSDWKRKPKFRTDPSTATACCSVLVLIGMLVVRSRPRAGNRAG